MKFWQLGMLNFRRKCLGKMSDVALEGRTVLFVSHNMSAILRLTQETLVIEKGLLVLRAPDTQAIDYYLSRGLSQEGKYYWKEDEIPANAEHPFRPIGVRILNHKTRFGYGQRRLNRSIEIGIPAWMSR